MTVDLEKELRDGLEGVTPGPWRANEGIEYPRGQQYYYITDGCSNLADDVDMADAAHIARCSPENIAALLDRIEAIRAENERLRKALERIADYPDHSAGSCPGIARAVLSGGQP